MIIYTKQFININIEPLTHLINLSFEKGIFPNELKTARIIPLFKSGSSVDVNNYRSISILSFFSKIFEKLAYGHTTNFINNHNLIYKHQF